MSDIVRIFDIPITLCDFREAVNFMEKLIASPKSKLVVLANVYTLNLAYEQGEYKNVLKGADLILRDGSGISWALKRKGIDPLHNFVGTDFIPDFCKAANDKGYSIYFLGSLPGIAKLAAEKLKKIAPGINIAGTHHGYFAPRETDEVINRINSAKPDILLVAMGNPYQEIWIARHLDKLNVPVCIGVGALFDYLSGTVRRAPDWMLKAGMEWIYRLFTEPARLWRRYLIGNPKFIMRIVRGN